VAVKVRYYTDPACSWSWSTEPIVRRLMVEFGDNLSWTYVMGGLARDYTEAGAESRDAVYLGLLKHWMRSADEGGMPIDPRLWTEGPIASTYPACMAVKAASEQGQQAVTRYLRTLREGLMCFRRKLDTAEALVEAARASGLDVERFRLDLHSNAIVEAFGNDLEERRHAPEGRELELPSMVFVGDDGSRHGVYGYESDHGAFRQAAEAAGAAASGEPAPGVLEALRWFGRMATREVEEVCGLRGPRAHAALWELAERWEVRPVRVLTGYLWELA
jgi:predicted DsbA family dithiol-disulfide isomerase